MMELFKTARQTLGTLLILFTGFSVLAIGTTEPPLKKGASIEVASYDGMTKAIEVKLVNQPAVGPNYADVKDLVAALGLKGEDAANFKQQPMKFKGTVYNLQSDLKLLNFYELKARLPKKEREKLEAAGRKARAEAQKKATKTKKSK